MANLKTELWNAFVDSELIGICDDDCSILPRFLPSSYLPTIHRTCRDITEFLMRLLSLPSEEIKDIIPSSPIVDYLIDDLAILTHRRKRVTGSLRFDMAIVGKPTPKNPPKLLEVNEIGFDGTGRSSYIQETILKIFPELKKHVRCLDTALSETINMRRLGKKFARLHYNYYNWEEQSILMKARKIGLDMKLISPSAFRIEIEDGCDDLSRAHIRLQNNKVRIGNSPWKPDCFQVSYSFELGDYKEAPKLFRDLVRTKTPQYSPFLTGLIAPKTILTLMADKDLRQRIIGKSKSHKLDKAILPARLLEGNEAYATKHAADLVMKHADGMGGELVWVGKELLNRIKRITVSKRKHYVLQDRVRLNTIEVDGILSRRRRVMADLGVYIHYDWNGKRFTNFKVGGFITRATNRSLKVNVSGGGIQVPVMFY
ncbi:MAG: hypothetical protein HN337_02090 [Deltaproteobacteria bacterium]|nr:hypothetical protein [Deltaproteobacteria bacterium]